MSSSVEKFLAHYGVKGMKWGVRKDAVVGAGYRGTGMARVSGNLSPEEGKALASLVANSHVYSKQVAPKVEADLKAINSKYDPNSLQDDVVYSKYRDETRKMYEKHLNESLPEGLQGKILSHPNLDYPGYVVIGNKAGVDAEVSALKKEGFKHEAADHLVKRFSLVEITENGSRVVTSMSYGLDLEHSDSDVDEFLAHYGVKGMKWGVRRSREALARAAAGRRKSGTKGDVAEGTIEKNEDGTLSIKGGVFSKAKPGDVVVVTDGEKTVVATKRPDGKFEETRISADAERLVKTLEKDGWELSDREMQDAINRAEKIRKYNEIFGNDPNSELKQKLDALQTQKKYQEIQAEMRGPSKAAQAAKLIAKSSGSAWAAYQTLNKATGGQLGRELAQGFKLSSGSKKKSPSGSTSPKPSGSAPGTPFKVNPNAVKIGRP